MQRTILAGTLAAIVSLQFVTNGANAQQSGDSGAYPGRPVRVIQSAAPGGDLDLI